MSLLVEYTTEERISDLKDALIESPKTKKEREQRPRKIE